MQSTTKTIRLLCLTNTQSVQDDIASKLVLDGRDVDIVRAESRAKAVSYLDESRIDCILWPYEADRQARLTSLRTLREEVPAIPVVVFVGSESSEYVDAVIEAGATEVFQSTAETVSETLLRRRIESVVDGRAVRSARDRTLERYETLLNTVDDAIYRLDADGTILAVNDAATELTGYDRSALVGSNVAMVAPKADVERGKGWVARACGEDEDGGQTLETTVQTKAGHEIDCETRFAVLRRGDVFEGTVGVVRDISGRRERDRPVRERNQMLQQLSENINDAVWITSPDRERVEFVSAAYEEIYGHPRAALYEDPDAFLDEIHPEDREAVTAALERQRIDPESFDETYRVVQPDGDCKWVHDRAFGAYDDGELIRIVGVAQDITERRETQQELAAERDMFAQGPAVMFTWDTGDGWPVQYVSENVENIFGYTAEELESGAVAYADLVYEDDFERVAAEVTRYSENGATRFTHEPYRIVTRDGEVRWVTDTTKIVRDGEAVTQYQGYLVDITERKIREQKIQQQRDELAQLDRLNGVIRDVDQALVGATSREEIERLVCERLTFTGQYYFAIALRVTPDDRLEPTTWTPVGEQYVEDGFPVENITPETSPGLRALETGEAQVVEHVAERAAEDGSEQWEDAAVEAGIGSLASIPMTYGDSEYGVVGVYASEPAAFGKQELEVLGELGETIGYAVAAVERREREETLTALNEATSALLGTATEQEVSDVVVDVATDVLDLPGVGIFLFDDEENHLRPVSATDTLLEFYSEPIVFGPGRTDSIAWHTYATGEQNVFDDVRNADRVSNPDTDGRSTFILPLGEHGVFVTSSQAVGVFDDQKRELVSLLAATTEAALDRVAGQEGIRELDAELSERTRRLERLAHSNSVLRGVSEAVVENTSGTDIEQAVCDRLVDGEYAFAWVGASPPDGTVVEPHAWAGDSEYLDAVSATVGSGEPGARAARDGDVVVVDNVTDHLRDGAWARAASEQGYQSALAVPLVYGESTYGVLTVYATEPGAFGESVSDAFADVGRLVGYGLSVAETKQGILAKDVAELELDIGMPNTFPNAVAALAGASVQYRETTPDTDGTTRVLFELADPPVEEILALESEFVAVESVTHLDRGDQHTFRATLNSKTVAGILLKSGGIPQRVVAGSDRTQAIVRLPQQQSVRTFLERVRETYPETELRSKRERQQTDAHDPMQFALETELTGRQREVLVTAYESGFFESPRETTGAELADLLDVSQPTVTHHLREAQRRLFAELLDDEESPDL